MADIVQPTPRARRLPFVRAVRIAAIAAAVIMAAAIVAIVAVDRMAAANIPPYERVDDFRYLAQGWGTERDSAARETYYYTAQGAPLHGIRYRWFINLEQPLSRDRFADPDYLRSLGFIVDPAPTPKNPDRLPIGFARRHDEALNEDLLDVTCAACHTGELQITRNGRRTAIRIDGGQAMHAFTDMKVGHFAPVLAASLASTYVNPIKFNRFAERVLGPGYPAGKSKLSSDLWAVLRDLYRLSNGSFDTNHYPVQEGFGRTDALARISNTVFGDHVDPANYRTGNAPVSFPPVWDIWKFDWVQYNASVSSPMARNVGEVMGTGAIYQLIDDAGRPIPAGDRYRTSISFDNLHRIESTLQRLKPPPWPEDLLGTIDRARAERGRVLFDAHCQGCHGPHVAADAVKKATSPLRPPDDPLWIIRWKAVQDVGTDPTTAMNFYNNRVDLTRIGLTPDEVKALLKNELDMLKARQAGVVPALQEELARAKSTGAAADRIGEIETQLEYARNYPVTDASIARVLAGVDLTSMNVGTGLNVLGLIIRQRYYTDHRFSSEARACFEGFDMLDLPQVVPGYKPRPLEGVWATPPFLHNGSVPNLYELLSPVAERSKRFPLGSREFDPVRVGYAFEPATSRGFIYDTTIMGNLNIGHEFRAGYVPFDESRPASAQYQGGAIGPALTPAQRMELIEYLKIHRDDRLSKDGRTPPDCFALLPRGR